MRYAGHGIMESWAGRKQVRRTRAWHSTLFSWNSCLSSIAFLLARARLASFSCRNLLKRTRDSCSSKSFFFNAASLVLKPSSCAYHQSDASLATVSPGGRYD